MRLSPWISVLAIGCGEDLKVTMVVEPAQGIAPLSARLSASSVAEGKIVRYRFDFDGDGTFDTEASEAASIDHEFGEGVHRPRVEASIEGATAIATAEVDVRANQPPAPKLDASPLTGRQGLTVA